MLWLISYDVPDDRKRSSVAAVLATYGVRVQWSVFECRIEARALSDIQARIIAILGESGGGNVRGYRICDRCAGQGWVAGDAVAPIGADTYVIV